MGKCRFLYNNLITDESMLTVSSLRYGLVTAALKEGTGSAMLNPSGNYSGSTDKEYIIEIDSVAAGAEVGQATFRWSDGGGSWNASGVTTSATDITLNSGVQVNWKTGSGADFVVGDKWYLKGVNLFNAGKMLDLDRDHRYRSLALEAPNTIAVDLGSAQEVKALAIYDHNFTAAATLLLEADDAATFDSDGGSAQFSEAVTWADDKILHYLSAATTKRYWRLSVTDAANTDGYIEIGELYLGGYMEMSRTFSNGFTEDVEFLMQANETSYGVRRDRFYNTRAAWNFNFSVMAAADVTLMRALLAAISDRTTGKFDPFYFNKDSATPADFYLVKLEGLPVNHRVRTYYDMPLTMVEVLRSV